MSHAQDESTAAYLIESELSRHERKPGTMDCTCLDSFDRWERHLAEVAMRALASKGLTVVSETSLRDRSGS
jgi:hypothetical protein